jgi:hypothetical protein
LLCVTFAKAIRVLGFYDALGYTLATSIVLEKWIDPSRQGDSS